MISFILHDCSISDFAISAHMTVTKLKTLNCYIAFTIKSTYLKFHGMIQDGRLHDCSKTVFLIFGHVTQEWGQTSKRWIAVAPLLSNLWIWNFMGLYQTKVFTTTMFKIFWFTVMWTKNEVKAENVELLERLHYQTYRFETS